MRRILDFSRVEVEEFLASRLGGVPRSVKGIRWHYLVQVDSEESQLTLLPLHGKTVGGEPMVVTPYRATMTAEEIFTWLEEKLKDSETAKKLGGALGP